MTREFIVAKNPDPQSSLPYVLQLPLDGAPIWLKAKDAWPRAARVFCHPLSAPPIGLEILERIPVKLCKRSGKAIDLVLDRNTNRRSQFVFVHSGERTLIFWQTLRTAAAARPGLRIPGQRSTHALTIYVDTRERYPYSFGAYGVAAERRTLPAGDYAAIVGDRTLAVVERKAFDDFVSSLCSGSLMFAMADLCGSPVAAVAVEGAFSALLRHEFTSAGFVTDALVRLQIRYPSIQIHFLETKKLAQEWTYRYLGAAYDEISP